MSSHGPYYKQWQAAIILHSEQRQAMICTRRLPDPRLHRKERRRNSSFIQYHRSSLRSTWHLSSYFISCHRCHRRRTRVQPTNDRNGQNPRSGKGDIGKITSRPTRSLRPGPSKCQILAGIIASQPHPRELAELSAPFGQVPFHHWRGGVSSSGRMSPT